MQVSGEDGPWTTDQSLDLDLDLTYEPDIRFLEQIKQNSESQDASGGLTQQYEHLEANEDRNVPMGGEANFAFAAKRLLSDGEDGLKKVDSFSRWISKELGDVVDLQVQSTSGLQWSTDECGNVEESSLGPSISQDQLFSILDFSPKWAYGDSGIKVRNQDMLAIGLLVNDFLFGRTVLIGSKQARIFFIFHFYDSP